MTQNTIVHILLGAAFLPAIVSLYLLLAPNGEPEQLLTWRVFFAVLSLFLIVAALTPSAVHRLRGLAAPQPLPPSDVRFLVQVTVLVCILVFVGVQLAMWWMVTLGFMLPTLSFLFRSPRAESDIPRNY